MRNQKIRYDSIGKAREGREETNNSSNSLTRRCRLASEDCGGIDAGQGRKETNKQRAVCEPTNQTMGWLMVLWEMEWVRMAFIAVC